MYALIDRLLHMIGHRHADWRPYPPVMMRWHDGRWERREPSGAEALEMIEAQAFQM